MTEDVYEKFLARRIIFLVNDITDESANRATAQLLLLAAEQPDAPVHLYVSSAGGSVSAAMAVWDTMQLIPCDVATYAMGMAAGVGLLLVAAGTAGRRHALPLASLRLTPVTAGADGATGLLEKTRREIAGLFAGYTGRPVEQVLADMARGRAFSPIDAVTYGLVDRIVDRADPAGV